MTELKPPAPHTIWNEALTAFEIPKLLFNAPGLANLKASRPKDVIVLPGFGAGDASTIPLRSYLSYLGHRVAGWDRGLNTQDVQATMFELVDAVAKRPEQDIILVGWSLGGYLAREVARELPHQIEQVFKTLSNVNNSLSIGGSTSNTSSAAPAILFSNSIFFNIASSIKPPRAKLIKTALLFNI
mgnify:CR=1 FL=1